MLIFVCIYICIYVRCCLTDCLMICIYVYVCILLSDMVIRSHSCGGMISYAGEWHEGAPGLMRNQLGGVALTYI